MQCGLYLKGRGNAYWVTGRHEPNRRTFHGHYHLYRPFASQFRPRKGFMRTMLDRLIEAREREARRYVDTHFTVMAARNSAPTHASRSSRAARPSGAEQPGRFTAAIAE